MTLYIAPIVEGQTEQLCIERLLQRVWHELLGRAERLQVVESFRGHRDALVHPSGAVLTDAVGKSFVKLKAKAKRNAEAQLLVLILLDAEGDCPATLAPCLLDIGRKVLPGDIPVSCVLAKRMLENWVVAGASTLAGVNNLPDTLPTRDQFEDRSGVAWLQAQLRSKNKTRKYKKTADAAEFVRDMNLHECRNNSPSFDKLCRELESRLSKRPDGPGSTEEAGPPTSAGGLSL